MSVLSASSQVFSSFCLILTPQGSEALGPTAFPTSELHQDPLQELAPAEAGDEPVSSILWLGWALQI